MVHIVIQSIGLIDGPIIEQLHDALERNPDWAIAVGPSLELPSGSFDPRRQQYSAPYILAAAPDPGQGLALLVADVDLFTPGMNFIFGLAQPEHHRAVISLSRLHPERDGVLPNRQLFLERATKEAIHELGHLLGLPHCREEHCVMHFSNTLADTDYKGASFCPLCQARLSTQGVRLK